MGYLGGYITVHNKTDQTLNICIKLLKPERCCKFKVEPQEKKTNGYWTFSSWASFKVKLGDREQDWCDDPDLWCLFNPRDNPYFTIQESKDRQYIELHCNTNHKKKISKYPNYGKSLVSAIFDKICSVHNTNYTLVFLQIFVSQHLLHLLSPSSVHCYNDQFLAA